DDLDLPVKVCYGNLGKLTLHIPWKNLYSEPTVATLEGLYLIAVPNLADVAAEPDSFVEKLAANVIKNLQTTDKNWKPTVIKDAVTVIFKKILHKNIAADSKHTEYQYMTSYSDIMELLESRERLTLGAKFRKYHPQVALTKDRRRWWHFAYESVLGETVRPRRNMWSWEHIKRHRKKYEKELDVFNIMLMRRQADLLKPRSTVELFCCVDVKKLMTPEEKAKLYAAIGYDDEDVDPNLPKQFVAVKVNAALKNFTVCLKDRRVPHVVSTIDSMMMSGLPHPEVKRDTILLSSLDTGRAKSRHLLSVKFETNPLDSDFNQTSTINQLAEFFKPPDWVHLKQLRFSAMSRFEELKEQTATGLLHAVQTRTYADIRVNFQPSYIILPQGGIYQSKCNMMVMDLGEFKIDSVKQERVTAVPSPTDVTGDHQLNYEEIQKKAYDIFKVSLQRLQLLYVKAGEDWKSARETHTPMHVLKPVKLDITLHKCMIQDKKLPSLKVQGVLPSLMVPVSDKRLQDILVLVKSIPFPESPPALEEELEDICLSVAQYKAGREIPILKLVIDSLGMRLQMRTFDMYATAYLGGIFLQYTEFKDGPQVAGVCE
ncbi:hypothetical protein NP493_702g01015, partial [Ridgeia piscesae]